MSEPGFFSLLRWWPLLLLGLSSCGLNWTKSYDYEGEEPYDLYVLHQLLEARPAGLTTLTDSLPSISEATSGDANYIFVGQYAYYSEREITHLLDFVEQGNTAFIAANELPTELAEHLFGYDCYYDDSYYVWMDSIDRLRYQDTVSLYLNETDTAGYHLVNLYDWRATPEHQSYIKNYYLCDPELDNEAIGYFAPDFINFVRLAWGEGHFYFNTQPQFFTNIYLVDTLAYQYANNALLVLNDGPGYWDEASRVPPPVARQRNRRNNPGNSNGYEGRQLLTGNETLSYIQEQPALAMAWYLLLTAAILYIVFRGKRRQRIIPIINTRENSSRRFIDTISRLVYQKGRHLALAQQELSNLRFYLQDRYNIRWAEGTSLPENLSELTGAAPELVKRANVEINLMYRNGMMDATGLVQLHRAIEPFFHL